MIILIYLAPIVLGYIVALVLKADSPIDEKALWRTRPVAGRKMLHAKLLFLSLFGLLVPCAIETVERLKFGFDAGECLRGFVETALIQAAWIGVIASAALLFRKTIAGVLTYVIIAIVVSGYGYAFLVHFNLLDQDFIPTPNPGYLGIGTGFVFFTLAVATVLMVAWQMYGGAPRLLGAKILAGGWALAGVVALLCRGLFLMGNNVSYLPDNGVKLTLQTQPVEQDSRPQTANTYPKANPKIGVTTYASLATQSFPELKGQVLWIKQVAVVLHGVGDKNLLVASDENQYWNDGPLLNAPVAVAAAGFGRLAWIPLDRSSSGVFFLNNAQSKLVQNKTAQWSGTLSGESGHFVPVADVRPWHPEGWQEGNTQDLPDVYGLSRVMAGSTITLDYNEIGPAEYLLATPISTNGTRRVFLLYNPRTKECIEASGDGQRASSPIASLLSIFAMTRREMDFNFREKLDENGQPLPARMSDMDIFKWVEESRLIVLRFEPDRRFSCTVTIDPFLVPKDDAQTPATKP
jgi:hypothetical protein